MGAPVGPAGTSSTGSGVSVARRVSVAGHRRVLSPIGLDPAAFSVIAIKSRVHFRRDFDDSGLARTILLVEPAEPFLGTVRLDALPYEHVDLRRYYPYGDPPLIV